MKNIELILLQASSKAFGNEIPNNWNELNDGQQIDWLENNRCYHHQHLSNDEYFNLIDCHSDTIKKAASDSLDILKNELIELAVNDKSPLNVNELDLKGLLFHSSNRTLNLTPCGRIPLGSSTLVQEGT